MTNISTLGAQGLRQHLRDLTSRSADKAISMPSHFYTSEAFLEFEKEQVFRREWVCIGHVGEIANSGDFYTTELRQLGRDGGQWQSAQFWVRLSCLDLTVRLGVESRAVDETGQGI